MMLLPKVTTVCA